jgi:hypothetical protein
VTTDEAGTCPNCGAEDLWRDSVDVGVGVIYGPYGCPCGWSESDEYNQLADDAEVRTDPWGGVYPKANPIPWEQGMAPGEAQLLYRLGLGRAAGGVVDDAAVAPGEGTGT